MTFNYTLNASLVGPGLTTNKTGIFDINYSGRAVGGVNTIYTLASDSTLYGQGSGANFGSTVASKITTLQGSTCTWDSNFSYNTSGFIPVTSANIAAWTSVERTCIVWANYQTSGTRDLATQIINAGGRVVSLVFGTIDFSGSYGSSEVKNMPTAYQILSANTQANLATPTTMTVQNVAGFADIANQSFTASNYYASSTPALAQANATVFLRDGSNSPYGAYYKVGSVGHAMIMLWPGSAYGFSGTTENSSIFTDIVARAVRAIS